MNKIIKIILAPEAKRIYDSLNEKSISNAIKKKIDLLKFDIHYGVPIAKRLFPKEYKLRYGITNLFRLELPKFWRLLYTITNRDQETEIIILIIELLDHKQYNKRFRYKNR